MDKFVIIIPDSTPAHAKAITDLFLPHRASWWHWSADAWLLSFQTEHPTAISLRDEIAGVIPGVAFVVFRADSGGEWGAWVTFDRLRAWRNWFTRFWV